MVRMRLVQSQNNPTAELDIQADRRLPGAERFDETAIDYNSRDEKGRGAPSNPIPIRWCTPEDREPPTCIVNTEAVAPRARLSAAATRASRGVFAGGLRWRSGDGATLVDPGFRARSSARDLGNG